VTSFARLDQAGPGLGGGLTTGQVSSLVVIHEEVGSEVVIVHTDNVTVGGVCT
jgi:hypothetical protein